MANNKQICVNFEEDTLDGCYNAVSWDYIRCVLEESSIVRPHERVTGLKVSKTGVKVFIDRK